MKEAKKKLIECLAEILQYIDTPHIVKNEVIKAMKIISDLD